MVANRSIFFLCIYFLEQLHYLQKDTVHYLHYLQPNTKFLTHNGKKEGQTTYKRLSRELRKGKTRIIQKIV